MKKIINDIIVSILPKAISRKLKNNYVSLIRKLIKPLSIEELKEVLIEEMNIKKGDTLFIHSSLRNLNINFSAEDIFYTLKDVVGQNGVLLFPAWQFRIRAEEYYKQNSKPFDVNKTRSKMGFLSEFARMQPDSLRSIHPTNSVIGIGGKAAMLLNEHHLDKYPLGTKSPFFKMIDEGAKIIGIGVGIENITFLHCIEDVMGDKFPIKTRNDEIFEFDVIDKSGKQTKVNTYVASENVSQRNVSRFFKKHISSKIYSSINKRGNKFFVADSEKLFQRVQELALECITIYNT